MFEKMGRITTRYRYPVIIIWVVLLAAIAVLTTDRAVAASSDQSEMLHDAEYSVMTGRSSSIFAQTFGTIGLGVTLCVVMSVLVGLTFAPAVKTTFQQRATLRVPKLRVVLGPAAVLLAAGGLAFLALVASQQAYSDADLQIARWARSLDLPGLEATLRAVNTLTDAHVAIVLWIVAGAFFVLRGRPLEAVAVFLISGLWVGDSLLSVLVNRPSPAPELVAVVEFSRGASFPSGHVTGAVTLYGILTFLILNNARRGLVRVMVPALSILVIGLASLGRVYVSAHWPSDVLGSYLFGSLGVVAIAALYIRVKEDRLHRPRLRKERPAPAPQATNGIKIAHSIASTVYLDPQAGTAAKEYNPPPPVRALHRLAFQAPFPYQHKREALQAAAAKRVIVGLLTRHWFGHDMVAKFYEIRESEKGYQFVTEFVAGTEPASNMEIADTLTELYTYFQEVGLSTWQIAPGNPHAYSNFIRTSKGELKLIDLESALVSVSYPWQELRAALRDGYFPTFDDVDFVKLRRYVQNQAQELTESLGRAGFATLEGAVRDAEQFTQTWKESEPRIWGRLARRVYRILNVSRLLGGVRSRLDGAESMANTFVSGAIDRWESDGLVDRERAASLRQVLSTSEAETLLKHLGAHLILSVAIAIPIPGLRSAARFGWTLSFRLKALYALGRGRMSKEEYRVARSVHSVPVMLLALVPALGAIAYAGSDTMVKSGLGRMLLDQSAHKVPFGLYGRLRLDRITAPRTPEARAADAGRKIRSRKTSTGAKELVDRVCVSPAHAVAEPLPFRIGDQRRRVSSSHV